MRLDEEELFNYLRENLRLEEERDYYSRSIVLKLRVPSSLREIADRDGCITISSVTLPDHD